MNEVSGAVRHSGSMPARLLTSFVEFKHVGVDAVKIARHSIRNHRLVHLGNVPKANEALAQRSRMAAHHRFIVAHGQLDRTAQPICCRICADPV